MSLKILAQILLRASTMNKLFLAFIFSLFISYFSIAQSDHINEKVETINKEVLKINSSNLMERSAFCIDVCGPTGGIYGDAVYYLNGKIKKVYSQSGTEDGPDLITEFYYDDFGHLIYIQSPMHWSQLIRVYFDDMSLINLEIITKNNSDQKILKNYSSLKDIGDQYLINQLSYFIKTRINIDSLKNNLTIFNLDSHNKSATIIGNDVSVRSAPSINAEIVYKLQAFDEVEVTEVSKDGWTKLADGNWIFSDLLDKTLIKIVIG